MTAASGLSAQLGIEFGLIAGLIAIAYGIYLISWVLKQPAGNATMQEIAGAIQEGAMAFLRRQYTTVAIVAVVLAIVIAVLPQPLGWQAALGFVIGAVLSGAAGFIGMIVSVRANVRTAEAARGGLGPALRLAFNGGAVTGLLVVGLGLFAVSGYYALMLQANGGDEARSLAALVGLAFGCSLISVFARLGGGIFTKAADVGADLVGKIEQGIPEDDPRNAATIADNVGDNVGDCAGMAADLFESYAVTLVAALILGRAAFGDEGLVWPLIVPAIGAVTAIIGVFLTRLRPGDRSGMTAINRAFFVSAALGAVLSAIAAFLYLPTTFAGLGGSPLANVHANPRLVAIAAVVIGIVLAVVIQQLTGYFTETGRRPVRDIGRTALTGPATVILAGITVGLESAVYTAILIGAAVYGAYLLGAGSVILSLFAVAMAGTGLLTTVGVIVAMDTFGPISDNAQGIAEMSGDIDENGAQVLTDLDAVGNTTKAITKGIAIATAVLAATALFGSFTDAVRGAVPAGLQTANQAFQGVLNVADPHNLVGLIIGASVVFLFSALAINAVTRAAGAIVFEVRRQFREIPGIMEGTTKPEYAKVVDICTRDSLRELATPGLLAVMAPIAVGFGLGVSALGAYLAGAIATGVLMAIFLANSGGAWDNAKKMVEDGAHGGKGSSAHEATIIGDTVGDPFKDTAGPSINPLIKVMNLVSLLIAPAIVTLTLGTAANAAVRAGIAVVATAVIVVAVVLSKRRSISVAEAPEAPDAARAAA
ncbi:MAG TPA: sodium-translocating pyrophosphatase [Candidatus Elarobacter sp.]